MDLISHQITNGRLTARVTNYGACLMDLRLAGVGYGLVLGFPELPDQAADLQFMGAVIGRYANRIAGGHVPWGETALALDQNEAGRAHLHGGCHGFARVLWQIEEAQENKLTLRHDSPDGDGGYPGDLITRATYEIIEDTSLRLTLSACSSKDTIINLCHHPYFNLDGLEDVRNHHLWIAADAYLPSDDTLLPTGEVRDVTGTQFDFRHIRQLTFGQDYNNTYCLHTEQTGALRHVASLQAGSIAMHLQTTQPGLHLYNGYKVRPTSQGHEGRRYGPRAGLCLEAQAWPDSPNHADFPEVTLRAGETYEQITDYCFENLP